MAQTEGRGKGKPGTALPEIPDKLYFRIGEVARLLDLPTYVLRFWESEFPQLKPNKGGTGQRLYKRRDVEMALEIRRLLYDEGYTIPGARQLLKGDSRRASGAPQDKQEVAALPDRAALPASARQGAQLRRLQAELRELSGLLARPLPGSRRVVNPMHLNSPRRGLHIPPRRRSPSEPRPSLFDGHSSEHTTGE